MDLFIVRHAVAVPKSNPELDPSRPLTPKGHRRLRQVVKGLARLEVRFDALFHSPWVRAVETAQEMAPLVHGETIELRELADTPGERLLANLEGDSVAVVGHEPWLTELVSLLLFGTLDHAASFVLKKSGVVRLEGEPKPGSMKLVAFLPPSVLAAARE